MPAPRRAIAPANSAPEAVPEVRLRRVVDLVPYERNARKHSDEQIGEIAKLVQEFGWTSPILVDGSQVVAGHGRRLAAILVYAAGGRIKLPDGRVLPDGTVPTLDVAGWTEPQRRAYVLADNRSAEKATWDAGLVTLEVAEIKALGFDVGLTLFSAKDLLALNPKADGPDYTNKIEVPIYEPTGEKPPIAALVDETKTRSLIEKIEAAAIGDDLRAFLVHAARRHTVFDYRAIAEFYSHADPEVQDLMEQSALVIVDFGKAIEGGFVELSEKIEDIYRASYGESRGLGPEA